jgi:hypothetical protein
MGLASSVLVAAVVPGAVVVEGLAVVVEPSGVWELPGASVPPAVVSGAAEVAGSSVVVAASVAYTETVKTESRTATTINTAIAPNFLFIFSVPPLLGFFVKSVLAAESAVLLQFESVRIILLVLFCVIVSLLALGADKGNLDPYVISHE